MGHTQIVQAASNLHHLIGNPRAGQAQLLLDDATPLDPGDDMFDDHPHTGQYPIEPLVAHAQFLTLGLFLGCALSTPSGS